MKDKWKVLSNTSASASEQFNFLYGVPAQSLQDFHANPLLLWHSWTCCLGCWRCWRNLFLWRLRWKTLQSFLLEICGGLHKIVQLSFHRLISLAQQVSLCRLLLLLWSFHSSVTASCDLVLLTFIHRAILDLIIKDSRFSLLSFIGQTSLLLKLVSVHFETASFSLCSKKFIFNIVDQCFL